MMTIRGFQKRLVELKQEIENWKLKFQDTKEYQHILESEIFILKQIIVHQNGILKKQSEQLNAKISNVG